MKHVQKHLVKHYEKLDDFMRFWEKVYQFLRYHENEKAKHTKPDKYKHRVFDILNKNKERFHY